MKMRFIIILAIILLLIPNIVLAQPSLLPPCIHSGNCGLCDIIDVVSRVTKFMFYALGAVLFLLIVAGIGWLWIMRQTVPSPEKVQQGKDLLKGALWGTLFILIAWQLVNLVLFAVGTHTGRQMYEKSADATPNEKQITFKLFDNPWNYICDPNYGALSELEDYNQRVCFSRGDGTPCLYKKDKSAKGSYGVCLQGVCSTQYKNACDYLVDKYGEYFGTGGARGDARLKPYSCTSDNKQEERGRIVKCANNNQLNCRIECLEDTSLCSNGRLCCGEVLEAGKPY